MMKSYTQLAILGTIIFLSTTAYAASTIGVSPATITFEDVLRGGYAERIITITSSSEHPVSVEIEPRGEIESWVEFSKREFNVTKGEPYYLVMNVTPPRDVANKNYTGFLRVRTSRKNTQTQNNAATGIVIPVVDLHTTVEITDIEYRACRADKFKVASIEEGDMIRFNMDILNTGNVRINPKVKIDFWDTEQSTLVKTEEYTTQEITPTTKEAITIEVPSQGMDLGQYWVDIAALDCYAQQTITFDILEEGSLRANGILEVIRTKNIIEKDETTRIEPIFRNTGEKAVEAYFKGRITKGDQTVQLIETEKRLIEIDQTEAFEAYFTPAKSGRYFVSGVIIYDNKRTYERSAVINVIGTGVGIKAIFQGVLYILLIAGIIFISYKIRQEKKKYKKNLRRVHR